MEPLQTPPPVPGIGVAEGLAERASPFLAGPGQQVQQAAATPLTPLAGPLKPHPSPLRRRGYFTDMHGGGAFARMPSLFARADERSSKLMSAGTTLPTEVSPDACPSPTTACKDKLHRSFQIAKLQVNRDLESFLEDARRAAAAGVDDGDSLARVVLAAERCLEEDVAAFRDSIQSVVDGVEELRRSCAAREVRGWATRLLFILTRCSRLVATEEGSPLGGGGSGGRHAATSAYLTVQPRSRGPARMRRFSGFPMLRNQLSLDQAAPHALPLAAPPSPRGGASPLLRSATAPSRSFRDLLAGVHHLRLHDGGGAGGPAPPATLHLKLPPPALSPMPESPSTVRSPAGASDASTPSQPARQVGLSPLGRSVVTALEAELEQAACQQAAAGQPLPPGAQQAQQQAGGQLTPGASSGTATPTAADSPSKRQGLFKLLRMRFHGLRSASKERAQATRPAAQLAGEALEGVDSSGQSPVAQGGASPLAAVAPALAPELSCVPRREAPAGPPPAALPTPAALLSARGARRAQSAGAAAMGVPAVQRLHPGVAKALTLEVESGSPAASPRTASPRRLVCRVCEQAVAGGALERHTRVCVMLEALCQEGGDVDAALTRLGNRVEEALGAAGLAAADFEALEDLVAACRQVASLQPDGSRQPQLRCEAIAALLQRLLDAGEAAAAAAGLGLAPGPASGGGGGLSPEAGAYACHVLRLVRRKLGELRTAVPGRMSDAPGSGASTPRAAASLSIDDFEILKPISRGAFGRVYLARKRASGDLYAIKVMRKVDLIRKNMVQSVKNERNILAMANNPFVVRFYASFTSRDNLYIVMEYLPGGDLFSLLRTLGALDEGAARQYCAEAVLALEYCHTQGIIHRDLKPDNLLVSAGGHIKLTDFGLSCLGLIDSTDPALPAAMDLDGGQAGPGSSPASPKAQRRSSAASGAEAAAASPASKADASLREAALTASPRLAAGLGAAAGVDDGRRAVGTPDYLAPELLLGTGHGLECDWWSLGCILYEFVVGAPPFAADTPQQIFQNILDRNISWPGEEEMSGECRDLIECLLQLEPKQRLGHRGAGEVKLHPWFAGVDWASLARQKVAFVPQPDCDTDTSYFSSKPVSQRSLALDLDSSRGELDLAAVTAAVGGGAGPPASPAASLASSRSASRGGSRRPSVRRRSLRQALAEPSGASLSELRGLRAATASASSGASSTRASVSGADAMALDAPGGGADLHRQRSSASEAHAWHRAQRRRGPGHQSRGASLLRGSGELPGGAAGSAAGPMSAGYEEAAAPPSPSSSALAAASTAAAEALSQAASASLACGRYAADACSVSGSSCGSPLGSPAYSSGGEAGSDADSEGSEGGGAPFSGFSYSKLELVQEQSRLEALREQYEEEFSEFDRPPDLAALRSLTPSPERPPPRR